MQLRAEQTRRALIDVAAELFDARGLRATGLLDISRGAGVSKGALYFHFSCKEDLADAVLTEARSQARRLHRQHLGESGPRPDDLCRFTTAFARQLRHDPVLRAGLRMEEEGDGAAPTLREEWIDYMHRHFSGETGRTVADLLTALIVGLETLGRGDRDWWSDETVAGIWKWLDGLPEPASPTDHAGTV